jgi:translocation and assembly module TamA
MTASRHRGPAKTHTRLARVLALALLACCFCGISHADELSIQVEGVRDPLLSNVRSRVTPLQVSGNVRLSQRRLQRIAEHAEREALLGLRPYGYYKASVAASTVAEGDGRWQLNLRIDPGPPLTVSSAIVEVTGPGASLAELESWKRDWPLKAGQVLDQTVWEARKQRALDLAETEGYLGAGFTEQVIAIDLENNSAALRLVLETGQQAVMGTVVYEQDAVRPGILELLPRFKEGQAYDAWLLEKLRLDLWRTGYFDNVELIEERRMEEVPPRVNLVVRAQRRVPNTYQGSLGFGTDTGLRAQVLWSRYLLSERGDHFNMGLGWQQKFNEYSFRSNYQVPRRAAAREFWTADLLINRKRQDVNVKESDTSEDYIELTSGDVTDYSIKGGRLIVRDFERGYQQIFETWYGQYLYETVAFDLDDVARDLGYGGQDELGRYTERTSSLAVGVNWDWPYLRGTGFRTVGHHHRAWITLANSAWGSEKEFNQAYVSSRWHVMLGERWKLLLGGELGYTDATVNDVDLELPDQTLRLSVTDLPNLYRFKAGGSKSVRGYGFESLSNNGLGSNNIVVASAEIEMNFRPDWSLAAFFDAGNAFNDWNDYELRKGVGVGVRWYSIAGPIRLDVARGLDLQGDPWRIHFTIGTPLL